MSTTIPNNWLADFATNVFSQCGEDGIIAKMLEVLPQRDGWCVEFGAWDGSHLSNTRNLISAAGYSAVLMEAETSRFAALRAAYADTPRVIALNRRIGFGADDGLDAILRETPVPATFDVLSIDIDGHDYHVWEAALAYRPKVVVIEYNPSIPDIVEFVQERGSQANQGSSIRSICALAKRKGYELVSATTCNAIFVETDYFPLFGIADNSIGQLRTDHGAETYLFQTFDGAIMLRGLNRLLFHKLPLREETFQVLPESLRKYPESYSAQDTQLFRRFYDAYMRLAESDPQSLRKMLATMEGN